MRHVSVSVVLAAALAFGAAAAQAQSGFPYDRDLVFEGRPMPGSKRVPILTFSEDGKMQIDLWCKRGQGQASVANGALTITIGTMNDEPCSPERTQADEEMLAALGAATGIALDGDIVTLTGPKPLRFRAATN
jgi:heat shock protein HslJ